MKNLKRTLAMCLLVLLSFSLFACNGKQGLDMKADDLIDSTSSQQRWLKNPDSKLVINPDAVDGNVHTGQKQGISFGIMDDSGNISKTVDDAFFILEKKEANGKGDEVVWEADFSNTSIWNGLDKVVANNSVGQALDLQVDKATNIRSLEVDPINLKESDYGVYFEVTQCDGPFSVNFRSFAPNNEGGVATITAPGVYGTSLRELVLRGIDKSKIEDLSDIYGEEAEVYFDFQFNTAGTYKLGKFYVTKLEPGYNPGQAEEALTWAPYSITSELTYPNGTAFKTTDYFANAEVINKKIECTAGGDFALAGTVNGDVSFDTKNNALLFTADGFNYVVQTKRKGTVSYYKTEGDMLSGMNASEDPSGAKYWVMEWEVNLDPVSPSTEAFEISVAASLTKSTEDLSTLAYANNSSSASKQAFENLKTYWDEFIQNNDVSNYIINIPDSK